MGIKEGGKLALMAAVGPMGLGAIDYALHGDRKPSQIVVTDIDQARLDRAMGIYTVEEAKKNGIDLIYVNTKDLEDPVAYLKEITGGGFDDIICFAPVRPVVELADKVLAHDGCLNFFAGPSKTDFAAELNFYNVHYASTHIVGTSGGNTDDLIESLDMMAAGTIDPSSMVTHIGGLNAVVDTTMNLPSIPGGKKLIYTNIDLELTALDDFAEKGKECPMFARLAEIIAANNGLWCTEAEKYLLANCK